MILLSTIREQKEFVIERLLVKNFDARELVDYILHLDESRRNTQTEHDNLQSQLNQISASIGELMKSGKKNEAEGLKQNTVDLKSKTAQLKTQLETVELQLKEQLVKLPNIPSQKVPKGKTAEDNIVAHEEGAEPSLHKNAKPHWDLAAQYDLIDFELGVKITGAGFPVYKDKGAKLQRALINFFLDRAVAAGYKEIQPPILINEESGFGTGQLPDKEGQMYHATLDNLFLIPTAEVPITNIYRKVTLKPEQLPVKMAGYTPCFRREAGSYGKDVRGLNRLHQFDKVEIVQIVHPDSSYDVLEGMKNHVAGLLRDLKLQFRILCLCGGDMSFASALTYDFEVYSAAQKRWLEVSSVSNFETFQSNRMELKIKEAASNRHAHTLNGSALALPRIVASLLENHQTEEGIIIPEALRSYTGFDKIA